MQEIFEMDPASRSDFIALISPERFSRYQQAAQGDEARAIALYCWNMRVGQSLWVSLQCWEIAFRNQMDRFLRWKYNAGWPYDERRFVRNLTKGDERRLAETKSRQERDRKASPVSTSVIVADLSVGFWVSLLSKRYDVPYQWRYNLSRIFPQDRSLDRHAAWDKSTKILNLRNRVAHHEPIYHLPLPQLHADLHHLLGAMSGTALEFAEASCNFKEVWELWHPPMAPTSGETG